MIEAHEDGVSLRITWDSDDKTQIIEKATNLMLGDKWREIMGKPHLIRRAIVEFEEFLATLPQEFIPVTHHFSGGVYAREMIAPADTVMTGKIHNKDHINILSKGSMTVITDAGVDYIRAPATFICKAGTKRVGYAHEDSVWTSIHATTATTVEEAEAELFTNDYTLYIGHDEGAQ